MGQAKSPTINVDLKLFLYPSELINKYMYLKRRSVAFIKYNFFLYIGNLFDSFKALKSDAFCVVMTHGGTRRNMRSFCTRARLSIVFAHVHVMRNNLFFINTSDIVLNFLPRTTWYILYEFCFIFQETGNFVLTMYQESNFSSSFLSVFFHFICKY